MQLAILTGNSYGSYANEGNNGWRHDQLGWVDSVSSQTSSGRTRLQVLVCNSRYPMGGVEGTEDPD